MPALNRPARFRAPFGDLPIDILPHILAQLSDRTHWHSCALVSKTFNRVATPLLYRALDSRIISNASKKLLHPSTTLLRRPELARYVRHVTETGATHRVILAQYPNITRDTLEALALCVNLRSITWIDDLSSTDTTLLAFLNVVRKLPLREITIRTHSDLGETVWSQLIGLTGLQKVSIWCMEGPPRVLQGWSGPLGSTLTHLELGRCAGVPPTILITVLSQLPLLQDLRLKGAPATSIPTILTYLPNLHSLDTEYLGSYRPRKNLRVRGPDNSSDEEELDAPPFPKLKHLTVRTSSMDHSGPQKIWGWIRELVPKPGLETFRLHAFTIGMSFTEIPRMFVLDLARAHGDTLKHFVVNSGHMTLTDIQCLCAKFPKLESITCAVSNRNVNDITAAISNAKNLHTLKLHIQWLFNLGPQAVSNVKFSLEQAMNMMLRSEDSKLRMIAIGQMQYMGRWVLKEDAEAPNYGARKLKFEVVKIEAEEKWET